MRIKEEGGGEGESLAEIWERSRKAEERKAKAATAKAEAEAAAAKAEAAALQAEMAAAEQSERDMAEFIEDCLCIPVLSLFNSRRLPSLFVTLLPDTLTRLCLRGCHFITTDDVSLL